MSAPEDAIDFDVIEGQKENIQSLPGGRSAKKLAQLYSPNPLQKLSTPTPTDTQSVHDCIRAEYEAEVQNLGESDDPLDVYDRYVRWTLEAYPSAQATPQSQLHTLLERATKTFVSSPQYKNDPRYLKLWLHYIHFFADAPRETYLFLSRHAIGEGLALFYEEYAEWLEGAGRWGQAAEVYRLGIDREARPVQRLVRKNKEFEGRRAQQPETSAEPSSPALPTARLALAAKIDPFAAAAQAADPQAPRPNLGLGGRPPSGKPAKAKLAVFSDADPQPAALSSRSAGSKGWDTIGSMTDRKKENMMEAKPWVGETLKAGGKKQVANKMAVFRDASLAKIQNIVVVPSKHQVTLHPTTGKKERIFVNLAAVYPTPDQAGSEFCFEEIMAHNRGWLDQSWMADVTEPESPLARIVPLRDSQPMKKSAKDQLVIRHDSVLRDENGAIVQAPSEPRHGRKKFAEVNETQIIQTKLDSPSGPKMRKKSLAEPTMTIHTRAATDDIYDIFNAPLKSADDNDAGSAEDDDDYESEDDYTTGVETTGMTKNLQRKDEDNEETDDAKSVSEWSDFSAHKHIPLHPEGESQNLDDAANSPDDVDEDNDENDTRDTEADTERQSDEEESNEAPRTRSVFIPLPPEDYEPPTRPYRDPAEVANNRLPFMTPITERTECSVEIGLPESQNQTPSRQEERSLLQGTNTFNLELLSSPLREIIEEDEAPRMRALPLTAQKHTAPTSKVNDLGLPKGPVIQEKQCSPFEPDVQKKILNSLRPPLASYQGFYDHRDKDHLQGAEIRRHVKTLTKGPKPGEKLASPTGPCSVRLADVETACIVKKELGAGAYARVYLIEKSAHDDDVENADQQSFSRKGLPPVYRRQVMEALKMEDPPTPWEFHMMRAVHTRLGPQHRAAASISYPHELHLYRDEAFMFLPYHPHGTLLDVVNLFRAEPSGVMDEQLAMFFAIELLRTVDALHGKNVLHGDLKADNCLLRLDTIADDDQSALSSQWRADGSGGWSSRGLVLIDFGRAIDMRSFSDDVEFVADWKTSAQDCTEMREGRPWTWQVDYFGLAGTIHSVLFGKYIETVRSDQGGLGRGGRRYKIRESLKRYWQTEIWTECFDVLLNPASFTAQEVGMRMPVLKSLQNVRQQMETWLEANCEKGVGLKSMMGKLEAYSKSRK